MGSQSEEAMFRMMLRKFTPKLDQMFDSASMVLSVPKATLYISVFFTPGSDMTKKESVEATFRSTMDEKKVMSATKPLPGSSRSLNQEEQDMLEEIFPLCAEMLIDQAAEWEYTPYDLFMLIRIKHGQHAIDDPNMAELQIRTRKGLTPRSVLIS